MKKIEDLKKPFSIRGQHGIPEPNAQPPSESEEEIIFPLENKPGTKPIRRKGFGVLKFVGLLALLGFTFFLGYLSKPESMKEIKSNLEQFASLAIENSEPVKQKITEAINTKITEFEKLSSSKGQVVAPVSKDGEPRRKIKYWQALMDPSFTSDKPGKSPMGMDLIPVYEDDRSLANSIRIQPNVIQNIGVKTTIAERRRLSRDIRTVGNLTYDERKVTHVHTKYEGWIEKLSVDFTGQEVKEDDMLAAVYSPELVSTQEELLLAMKYNQALKDNPFAEISKGAQNLLESARRRLELFDVPEHQIEELILNKKITKTMHIHSPVRGFVIKKNVFQGMYVKPGMSLYTIADLSNIWVQADIYEYELPWVQVGQQVSMDLSYFPGKVFKGQVTFIDPIVDPNTRTIKVRMEFENPKWHLKPDMYANVNIKSPIHKKAVALPEEAVIHAGRKSIVVVQKDNGEFDSREVVLGVQAEGFIQVLKGVKAGEKIVISSHFLIDSESKLKEAIEKMRKPKIN